MRVSILATAIVASLSPRAAAAAAARGRRLRPLPPSCVAALRSRSSSSSDPPSAAGTRRTTGQAPPEYPHPREPMFGGVVDAPGHEKNPDAIDLARFAVAEHNRTNRALEFVRLVKVRVQLVAGRMYYFTIEARGVDGGANMVYEAQVWLRPWENFKRLEAFEPVANAD